MAASTGGFETGVNGNNVSTADAGDATAWDTVFGATLPKYDSARAAHGTLSCKFTGSNSLEWSTAFGTNTNHYGRAYIWPAANPASRVPIITAATASSATNCCSVYISTAGKLVLADSAGTGAATSTNAIALSSWNRVEYHYIHNAATGSLTATLYTADATTAVESISAGGLNTRAAADRIRFGVIANAMTAWFDNIAAGYTAATGPFGTTFTQSLTASAAATATLVKGVQFNRTLTLTPTASVLKAVSKTWAASPVSALATTTKQVNKPLTTTALAATATLLAGLAHLVTLSASVAANATLVKQAGKVLATTALVASATIVKAVGAIRTPTAPAASATVTKQAGKPLTPAALAATVTLVKQVGKPLTATALAATATLVAGLAQLLTLTASVTASARLSIQRVPHLTAITCGALTLAAQACTALGLNSLADSALTLAARIDSSLSAAAAADDSLTITAADDIS